MTENEYGMDYRNAGGNHYIEEHITEEMDYEVIAQKSFSSTYHFQRVFSILCGYTLGEYIRNRRLTLAGAELAANKAKVTDVALKYGYDSPDSFAKAFQKFHGITPSQARCDGTRLKSFSKVSLKIILEGGNMIDYKIEEKPEMILTGYKKRFNGVPYGEERERQEEELFCTTRAKQWLLKGVSCDCEKIYNIVTNIDDEGYDYYIAAQLDEADRRDFFDPKVTGVDFTAKMDFEHIVIPKQRYAIFETEKSRKPVAEYGDLRKRIVSEWLPHSGYRFADAPEVVVMNWYLRKSKERDRRYVEIWLPIE